MVKVALAGGIGYLAYVYLAVCLAVGIKVFVGEVAVNACVYVR